MRRELYSPAQQAAMTEREDAIVAILEERPHTTGELGELFDLSSGMGQICSALARRGRIVRLPDNRWALPAERPTSTTPAVEHGPLVRRHVDGAAILSLLERGPLNAHAIADHLDLGRHAVQNRLDDLLRLAMVQRVNDGGRMVWALISYQPSVQARTSKRLRQPHERPATQTVKRADTLSWFCTAPQAGFTQLASHHERRMRESKEARSLPLRMLP